MNEMNEQPEQLVKEVHFQLILKKAVMPEHFLKATLRNAIAADSSAIGDYPIEQVSEWIEVKYFNSYPDSDRKILGFKITLPNELSNAAIDKIINENFANLLQPEGGNNHPLVEHLLRYQDPGVLADTQEFHPRIFDLEMKLREVLNHIFGFQLQQHRVWEFLKEFQNMELPNPKMKVDKEFRFDRFRRFFENELYHITMYQYQNLNKPKTRDIADIKNKINHHHTQNLQEVKIWLREAVDFTQFNEKHQTFINDITTRLNQIESLRNDIMHNRKIHIDIIDGFIQAERLMKNWIDKFWEDEKLEKFEAYWDTVHYLLDTIFKSAEVDDNDEITFIDFDFQEQSLWIDEFKESYLPEKIQDLIEQQFGIRLDDSQMIEVNRLIQQWITTLY